MIKNIFRCTHQHFAYNQYLNYLHKVYNDVTKTKIRGTCVFLEKSNDLNNNNSNSFNKNESNNGKSNKGNN